MAAWSEDEEGYASHYDYVVTENATNEVLRVMRANE